MDIPYSRWYPAIEQRRSRRHFDASRPIEADKLSALDAVCKAFMPHWRKLRLTGLEEGSQETKMTTLNNSGNLGRMIKQQRILMELTQGELAARSGVSSSHLGRVESGERFPSARILQKIAGPLGFDEGELFALAGYLSPQPSMAAEMMGEDPGKRLDPIVANMLRQEPIEVQRAVIGLLTMLKSIAKWVKTV